MKKLFGVTAMIISSTTFAQQDTSSVMDEVIITATKIPKKQHETGKVVTVIGKDILERSSGKSISDLLTTQAGITIAGSQGTPGTNQDLYLRGAAVGKTLILVDGIPMYDASSITNAFDLNNLTVDNVERIEIVRGGQSVLYGSDAVAGVINIITKKESPAPVRINAIAAAGSFNSYKGVAGVNGSRGKNSYHLQYAHNRSGGFSSAADTLGSGDFDRDGFRQDALNAAFSITPVKNLRMGFTGQLEKYRADLDADAFTDDKDFKVASSHRMAGFSSVYSLSRLSLQLNYHFNHTQRNYLNDSADFTGPVNYMKLDYTGRTHFAELFASLHPWRHADILIGADYRHHNTDQQIFTTGSWGPFGTGLSSDSVNAWQGSAFGSLFLKNLNGFHAESGVRLNHHSQYGNHFTWTVNPSWSFNKFRLFANWSTGFKAPTLYQLYGINPAELEPETSRTWEAGIQWEPVRGSWLRAVWFDRRVDNGIDYNTATDRYYNYITQQDHGLELEGVYKTGNFFMNFNYSWVRGKATANTYEFDPASMWYAVKGDTVYNNLFRRPEHVLNINAGYSILPAWLVSAGGRLVGKRYEPAAPFMILGVYQGAPVELKAYQVFDIYTEYRLKRITVFADMKNILDRQFTEIRGYRARGFNFMAGLRLSLP